MNLNALSRYLNPSQLNQLIESKPDGTSSVTTTPGSGLLKNVDLSYDKLEISVTKLQLIEEGIRTENLAASRSTFTYESFKLSFERLQVSAAETGGADGTESADGVVRTLNVQMTRATWEKVSLSFSGLGPSDGTAELKTRVQDYLRQFRADQARPAGSPDPEEGLTEAQTRQLTELRALLKTFTNQSDEEIDEIIGNVRDAFRQANHPPAAGTAAEPASRLTAEAQRVDTVNVELKLHESGKVEAREVTDPLVVDLDRDGVEVTDADSGVQFDLTGDGKPERTGTVAGDDAYLALDRDGNGAIDDGNELFGNQHGAANGYEELKKFDGNADHRIDATDAVFARLRLWTDRNRNGASEADELRPLPEAGLKALDLNYQTYDVRGKKNSLHEVGTVDFTDGGRGLAGDVKLSYKA